MGTIKEEAESYESPQTKNIVDLEYCPIDFELHDEEGKDKDGEVFKYKAVKINGESYRIPGKV